MTTAVQPEWMEGFTPKPAKWVKGMKSPNPNGRPKGILDTRSKITKALLDDGHAVAAVVLAAAKEGDLTACGMVLSRIAPAIRPETRPVEFDFDPTAPIPQQIEAVLAGIASGSVPVDVGKMIIDAIGTLSNARTVEELAARIEALEEKEP